MRGGREKWEMMRGSGEIQGGGRGRLREGVRDRRLRGDEEGVLVEDGSIRVVLCSFPCIRPYTHLSVDRDRKWLSGRFPRCAGESGYRA